MSRQGTVNVSKATLELLVKEVCFTLRLSLCLSDISLPLSVPISLSFSPSTDLCPNDCNNRGFCSTMRGLSVYRGLGIEYTNWDGLSTNLCDCDYGYTGHDCALTMCPKGDDPMTSHTNYKTIQLVVQGPKGFGGKLGIRFEGETTTLSLSTVTSELCEQQLEASKKFTDVTCTYYASPTGTSRTFVIEILSWPITPQENNIYSHDGNPSIEAFSCDLSAISSSLVSCSFTDLISTDLPGASPPPPPPLSFPFLSSFSLCLCLCLPPPPPSQNICLVAIVGSVISKQESVSVTMASLALPVIS
jgi:hypothetical protein